MKNKMIISMVTLMVFAATFTGCGDNKIDPDNVQIEESVTEDTSDVQEVQTSAEEADDTAEASEADNSSDAASIVGVYARTYTEEIEDEPISQEFSYIFKEDHTGVCEMQDSVDFKWDDKQIIFPDHSYDYTIDGDTLTVDEDGMKTEYTKKSE